MNHRPAQAREGTTSTLVEVDLTAASEDELRRRAAEGIQGATAELVRRGLSRELAAAA